MSWRKSTAEVDVDARFPDGGSRQGWANCPCWDGTWEIARRRLGSREGMFIIYFVDATNETTTVCEGGERACGRCYDHEESPMTKEFVDANDIDGDLCQSCGDNVNGKPVVVRERGPGSESFNYCATCARKAVATDPSIETYGLVGIEILAAMCGAKVEQSIPVVKRLDAKVGESVPEMISSMQYFAEGGDACPGSTSDPREALGDALGLAHEVATSFASGAFIASIADTGGGRSFDIAIQAVEGFVHVFDVKNVHSLANMVDDSLTDDDMIECRHVAKFLRSMVAAINAFAAAHKLSLKVTR